MTRTTLREAFVRTLVLIVLIVATVPPDICANGGSLKLDRAPVGPYLVSAWIEPDPPRPGGLDMSVAVMKPPGGEPVLDAEVMVRAEPVNASNHISWLVLRRGAGGNLLLYHGQVDLPTPGRWRITVVLSHWNGPREAAFEVDVRRRSAWPLVLVAVAALILVAVVAWRRRRPLDGGLPPKC